MLTATITSFQVLLIVLFVSDLTIGVVQLPMQIYVIWKSQDPPCFGIRLRAFSCTLPVWMSFTVLFLISLERYLNVVHNNYYKRVITNKSLKVTITLVTVLSIVRSTIDTLLATNLEKRKLLKLFNSFLITFYSFDSLPSNIYNHRRCS